jgi:glyoxylase-like metal-dependent hydrolase (beta-lactamase superfamily II)
MRLGEIEVRLIGDGTFRLDGGAMFGVIPKPLWEKKCPADERNRILLAMNILLIRAAGKVMLVETGAGDKWDAKRREIYAIETENANRLPRRLAAAGVEPEQIDIVLNTHLHFDHCGWNTRLENGNTVPTFPNAEYIVQRGEFEHALAPTERDRGSYFPENILPMKATGQWRLLDGPAEILPGIEVFVVPGHNANMQCVKITGGGKTVFFPADLVPTASHLGYPWIMGYDLFPLQTLENKKKWLPQAAREGWTVVFAHEPRMPVVKLVERNGAIEAEAASLE